MRKLIAAVFVVGLSAFAVADNSTGNKKEAPVEGGGKVKNGGACKVDADCDSSSRPQRCRDNKCEWRPTHPVT